jgi:hypothetical protein
MMRFKELKPGERFTDATVAASGRMPVLLKLKLDGAEGLVPLLHGKEVTPRLPPFNVVNTKTGEPLRFSRERKVDRAITDTCDTVDNFA